jgi:hypothetical protein
LSPWWLVCAVICSAGLGGPVLLAQDCDPPGHLDIAPVVQAGQILTGLADYETDPQNPFVIVGTKVWGGEFQTDPFDPYFTDDPGFTALSGSGLPPGSLFGWNALDDLKYWDGSGTIQFGPVPNGERLRIRLGGQNRCIGTGIGFQSGFNLALVDAAGAVHVHAQFFLLGPDGPSNICTVSPPVNSPTPPSNGIYLLTLQLRDSDASVADSAPVYVVFNNAAPACADCVALNYVGSELASDRPQADLDFDRDVDADDLARLRSCQSRAGVAWTDPCCQRADLDADGDIDLDDFGMAQRCYAGPGVPPDPGWGG